MTLTMHLGAVPAETRARSACLESFAADRSSRLKTSKTQRLASSRLPEARTEAAADRQQSPPSTLQRLPRRSVGKPLSQGLRRARSSQGLWLSGQKRLATGQT